MRAPDKDGATSEAGPLAECKASGAAPEPVPRTARPEAFDYLRAADTADHERSFEAGRLTNHLAFELKRYRLNHSLESRESGLAAAEELVRRVRLLAKTHDERIGFGASVNSFCQELLREPPDWNYYREPVGDLLEELIGLYRDISECDFYEDAKLDNIEIHISMYFSDVEEAIRAVHARIWGLLGEELRSAYLLGRLADEMLRPASVHFDAIVPNRTRTLINDEAYDAGEGLTIDEVDPGYRAPKPEQLVAYEDHLREAGLPGTAIVRGALGAEDGPAGVAGLVSRLDRATRDALDSARRRRSREGLSPDKYSTPPRDSHVAGEVRSGSAPMGQAQSQDDWPAGAEFGASGGGVGIPGEGEKRSAPAPEALRDSARTEPTYLGLSIDHATGRVRREGFGEVLLSKGLRIDILKKLMEARGGLVTKDDLRRLWSGPRVPNRLVTARVSALRTALCDPLKLIVTPYDRSGFQLLSSTPEEGPDSSSRDPHLP